MGRRTLFDPPTFGKRPMLLNLMTIVSLFDTETKSAPFILKSRSADQGLPEESYRRHPPSSLLAL
jgi:hypothetical protein